MIMSPYANETLTCMSWVTEHQIVIPVETGIQTKGLPDLGSLYVAKKI